MVFVLSNFRVDDTLLQKQCCKQFDTFVGLLFTIFGARFEISKYKNNQIFVYSILLLANDLKT